jgi:hypothetical protein
MPAPDDAVEVIGADTAEAPTPDPDQLHDAHHHDSHHHDSHETDADPTALIAVDPVVVDHEPGITTNETSPPDNAWVGFDQSPARDAISDASEAGESELPGLVSIRNAAMLSAGVLTLLAVRRRRHLRRGIAPARLPQPTSRQAVIERELRLDATGERFARVDLAVRAAAMSLVADGRRVTAVMCAPDGAIELIADGPARLPAPWSGSEEHWTIAGSILLEDLASEACRVAPPCPTLVQLGIDERGRDVYVDLETIGALEVGGAPEAADAVVAAVATTLASSVLAEVASLVSVGVPAAAFLGHRLHTAVDDVTQALEAAGAAVGSQEPPGSTFELRARLTSGEAWEPAVVLIGSGRDDVHVTGIKP